MGEDVVMWSGMREALRERDSEWWRDIVDARCVRQLHRRWCSNACMRRARYDEWEWFAVVC